MPNFSPTKFDFGSQIQRRREAKDAKDQAKDAKDQAEAQAAADSLEQGRTDTEADIQKWIENVSQQIEAGATEEQIEVSRKVVGQIVDSYVGRIAQFQGMAVQAGQDGSQFDPLLQFGEQQKQLFEGAVTAAQLQRDDTSEDVETLSPEQIAEAGFPKDSVVQRKADGTLLFTFDPTENPSAIQERVELLKKSGGGIDDETVAAIAGGRFAIGVNPITNEKFVMDLATGEEVGGREPIDIPEGEVPPLIPGEIETALATGGAGIFRNVANLLQDAVGAGTSFPEAQVATEALKSIQVLTVITLQAEVPGRPSAFLLEKLESLTVKPNSIFQGEERAQTRLEQTRRILEGEIQRVEHDVLPLELQPTVRVETQLNLTQMKRLRDAYDGLLKGFDEKEVDPELETLLNKHAPEDDK